MQQIDFWFSIGSTYTYLTVKRLPALERKGTFKVRWRPFSVRKIMQEMNNAPFIGKPVKEKYMWRDLQRRAEHYGFSLQVPVQYPLKDFDLANRIAVVAACEGWCEDYAQAAYDSWFQDGKPAGDEANIVASLAKLGQDVDRVITLAGSTANKTAYDAATDEARALGIFGSPSFVVGQELFWGDDRLEDAIDYCGR